MLFPVSLRAGPGGELSSYLDRNECYYFEKCDGG